MAAVTVAEVSEFVSDLPPLSAPASRAPRTIAAPAKPGPIGVLPFTLRILVPARREEVRWQILRTIAPRLVDYGYELVTQSPTGLVFECKLRPPWTVLAAIFAFPVGLIALTVRRNERIVFSLEEASAGETDMIIHGNAPRRVRKAFLNLKL